MSSEDGLWQTMRDKVSPYLDLHRVENGCERGTPDVAWAGKLPRGKLHGVAVFDVGNGWVELKECAWPARIETPLHIPKLYREQVQWAEEWKRAGGKVTALIQADRDYLLVGPNVLNVIFKRAATREHLRPYIIGSGVFPTTTLIKGLFES